MPCPFMSRLPSTFVRNYGGNILKTYAEHCPIASQAVVTSLAPNQAVPSAQPKQLKFGGIDESVKPANLGLDMIQEKPNGINLTKQALEDHEGNAFNYESFFGKMIKKKKDDHSYRIFRKVNRNAQTFPFAKEYTRDQKDITVWCSNDYLGMSAHPAVKLAVHQAVETFGVGAGGTRNISGNSTLHEDLEKELASLHDKQAGLVFTSCYVANDTTLFTLARQLPGCQIFSDAGNHASMIQGIKNSGVPKHVFKHNNPEDLEKHLKKVNLIF